MIIKVYNKQIYKLSFNCMLQDSKRYIGKSSHSSIKLPRIDKPRNHHDQSQSKIKVHDVSWKLINSNIRDHQIKTEVKPKQRVQSKGKSKSRAQGSRLKTDNSRSYLHNITSVQCSISNQELDKTLKEFNQYVKQNREHIRSEITKKAIKSKVSIESLKSIQSNMTKKKNSLFQKSGDNAGEFSIFQNLQQIIMKNATVAYDLGLQHAHKAVKQASLAKKIQKFFPKKSIDATKADLRSELSTEISQKIEHKNEQNFSKWKRISMSPDDSKPHYQQSNFENEHQRLQKLVLKTEASLCSYLEQKKLRYQLSQHMKTQQ